MPHIKSFLYLLLFSLIMSSCIEEYKPDIAVEDIDLYVIDGRVTDYEEFHSIYISKSSAINNLERIPVQGCDVRIYDDNAMVFQALESDDGEYIAHIEKEHLGIGKAFMLEIITPEGEILRSEYDTLRYCPEIDSVYYIIEDFATEDSDVLTPGIQFYIDYDGENTSSRNILFETEETWKYKSPYPLKWIWVDRHLITYETPDFSKSICWKTINSTAVYTISTSNLSGNSYSHFPLHRVLNTSTKLVMGYSILFKQLAISESAYYYFEKIKDNVVENGGLYETQPQLLEGNMYNISDPDERVLGYFFVAGKKEKREFISEVEDLPLATIALCEDLVEIFIFFLRNQDGPVYLWLEGGFYLLQDFCVDCTSRGGVLEKPYYWPE